MTVYSAWLNVPQAVVLEATRDIDLALGLTSENPGLVDCQGQSNSWPPHSGPAGGECRRGTTARRA